MRAEVPSFPTLVSRERLLFVKRCGLGSKVTGLPAAGDLYHSFFCTIFAINEAVIRQDKQAGKRNK